MISKVVAKYFTDEEIRAVRWCSGVGSNIPDTVVNAVLAPRIDERTVYYRSGKKMCELSWKDARPHGTWREWFECDGGHLMGEQQWRDGSKHGRWREWWSNGRQGCVREYDDDELHGRCKGWNRNGEQKYDELWHRGEKQQMNGYDTMHDRQSLVSTLYSCYRRRVISWHEFMYSAHYDGVGEYAVRYARSCNAADVNLRKPLHPHVPLPPESIIAYLALSAASPSEFDEMMRTMQRNVSEKRVCRNCAAQHARTNEQPCPVK